VFGFLTLADVNSVFLGELGAELVGPFFPELATTTATTITATTTSTRSPESIAQALFCLGLIKRPSDGVNNSLPLQDNKVKTADISQCWHQTRNSVCGLWPRYLKQYCIRLGWKTQWLGNGTNAG
jgi:hypothetical protein